MEGISPNYGFLVVTASQKVLSSLLTMMADTHGLTALCLNIH